MIVFDLNLPRTQCLKERMEYFSTAKLESKMNERKHRYHALIVGRDITSDRFDDYLEEERIFFVTCYGVGISEFRL